MDFVSLRGRRFFENSVYMGTGLETSVWHWELKWKIKMP